MLGIVKRWCGSLWKLLGMKIRVSRRANREHYYIEGLFAWKGEHLENDSIDGHKGEKNE